MKIILLGTAHPYRGGIATYNHRLAQEFTAQGHEVSIETFTLQYPSFLFPGKTQFSSLPAPEDLSIKRSVNSVNPFNWIKIGKKIQKERPDILILKYWLPFLAPCFGTIARLVRKNNHTKVICIADNIIPHEKRPGDMLLTRYFMNSIDGMIAMSKEVLESINLFSKTLPRAFCPHPLFDSFGEKMSREDALASLNLSDEYRYILFFGFIRDYKGLDLLIEAFADPRLEDVDIRLIIAGEFYADPAPYYKLIQKYNLEDRLILKTDFIPDNEVNRYFCASDLVVQPYKSATQSGVSQIAYHFEKPMIVTNVGGIPEMVPHGKVGYITGVDAKAVADAIIRFFREGKKEEFEKNIVEEKKKYTWNRMTTTILDDIYKKIKQ